MVYPDAGNFETNRKLWDIYAQEWSVGTDWVQSMAAGSAKGEAMALHLVGDEWSPRADLMEVVEQFILPYITPSSCVAEIGSGGGRVASCLMGKVASMDCFDISQQMLARCKEALDGQETAAATATSFTLLKEPKLPKKAAEAFDFVICFDVLVHVDLHIIYRYMQEIRRVLKPGGKAFISTANVCSEGGWNRFSTQTKYTVGGFHFLCPQIIQQLVAKAGLKVVKEGPPGPSKNVYYNRDYLTVLELDQAEEPTQM
ncbi:unnamed protein product [Chrysoparadoxa australica]